MVRIRITNFTLLINGEERAQFFTPLAASTRHIRDLPGGDIGSLSLLCSVSVGERELAMRHSFLRFEGISSPAELLVNDTKVADFDGIRSTATADIASALKLGDNRVELLLLSPNAENNIEELTLIHTNGAIIDTVSVRQTHDGGKVTLSVKAKLLGSPENLRSVATLVSSVGQIYYCGLTGGRGTITVKEPLYWWPRGLGIQNLYKLTVNMYGEEEIEDTYEMRVGLSSVATSKTTDGSLLEVNRVSVLPMGAVYKHSEAEPIKKRKMCEAVITSAARAGFNTLIIPLESPALPDYFYDLCDAHGILAIHEISELNARAEELVRISTRHVSLSLLDLIGNGNHIEDIAEGIRRINPSLNFAYFENRPEYPSLTTMPTDQTLAALISKDDVNIFSEEVESTVGESLIPMLNSAAESFPYARNLSDFAYISRLCGAEKVTAALASARVTRKRRAIFSHIGGAEAASPSSIDSMARWKALQYAAERCFVPIFVHAISDGYTVSFYLSNEGRTAISGEIEYHIIDVDGNRLFGESVACKADEGTAERIFVRDLDEHVRGREQSVVLEYFFRSESGTLSRGTLLFCKDKRLKLLPPAIRTDIVGDDRRFAISISSKSYARHVEIGFSDTDAVFSDNCFDLIPGTPTKISFTTIGKSTSARLLSESLRIKSLVDLK